MSAVVPLKATIELRSAALLTQALAEMGEVLGSQATGGITVLQPKNHPRIHELSFLFQNEKQVWEARADTWRMEKDYEGIMEEVQERYTAAKIITEMKNRHYNVERQGLQITCRRY